jgi:hypothetical protein
MTRRPPPKPPADLSRSAAPEDREARTLAMLLVPPDPLKQLAAWRAKVAARSSLQPSRVAPRTAPRSAPKKKR